MSAQNEPTLHTLFDNKLILLWGVVLAVVAAILLGGATLKQSMYAEEEARLEQQSRLVNHALVQHTDQLVRQVNALLNGVRQFYLRTGSPAEVEGYINALGFDKSVIENIYLIDAQGVILVSHGRAGQGNNVQDREYFQVHRTSAAPDAYISSVDKGRVTGRYNFRISMRVNKPDRSFAGIVLATIEPRAFSAHYQEMSNRPGRVASLVGTLDRKIRARYPELMPDQWQKPLDSPLWAAFSNAPSGIYQTRSAVDGIERIYVYDQVGDLPLIMLHGFSREEIEKNINTRFRQFATWGGFAALFILMLSVIFTGVFNNRQKLQSAYKKLAELHRKIRHQAMSDTLTGLPNRPMFFDRLSKELSQARRNDQRVALLFIDLDGFKPINDQFGHDAGDIVLKTVATRWQAIMRGNDTIARLGGDEFAVIISELNDPEQAVIVAEKLLDALLPEIHLPGNRHCVVGCSIGISLYPTTATEIDSLLAAADGAMYQSKSRGKNSLTLSNASPEPNRAEWIVFNSANLVGFAEIDDQHRQLVRQANEINQAIINRTSTADIERLLKQLIDYTVFHFATESRLMAHYQYPDRAVHEDEHQNLLEEVERLSDEFSLGNELIVLQTIKDWLLGHIEGADKPLGAFLAKNTVSKTLTKPLQ